MSELNGNGQSPPEPADISYMGIFILPCEEDHYHVQINTKSGSVMQQRFDTLEDAFNHLLNLNKNTVNLSTLFTEE